MTVYIPEGWEAVEAMVDGHAEWLYRPTTAAPRPDPLTERPDEDEPMTSVDSDGNVWQLKLLGETVSGRSIVVLLPETAESSP